MEKAKKLPSGRWNVRAMINGRRMSFTADTKKEAQLMAALAKTENKNASQRITFGEALNSYIESKNAILSESTIRGYRQIQRCYITDQLSSMPLNNPSTETLQRCLNECARNHSPKTVQNVKGLITSVLKQYKPEYTPRLAVPAKEKVQILIPTEEHVKRLINETTGLKVHLPILLAAFGSLRRSEVCALFKDAVYDDHITIKRAIIKDEYGKWVIKSKPKSWAGYRDIYLPDGVMEEVKAAADLAKDNEPIIGMAVNTLGNHWDALLKSMDLPQYHFHSLRHYYASYCHYVLNLPDKYIMKSGGWSDPNVLHKIYSHSMPEYEPVEARKVNDYYNKLQKTGQRIKQPRL